MHHVGAPHPTPPHPPTTNYPSFPRHRSLPSAHPKLRSKCSREYLEIENVEETERSMCPFCCRVFSMCARLVPMLGHKGRKTHTSLSVIIFFPCLQHKTAFCSPFFHLRGLMDRGLGVWSHGYNSPEMETKRAKREREREGENWESSPTWEATNTQGSLLNSFVCVYVCPGAHQILLKSILFFPIRPRFNDRNQGLQACTNRPLRTHRKPQSPWPSFTLFKSWWPLRNVVAFL